MEISNGADYSVSIFHITTQKGGGMKYFNYLAAAGLIVGGVACFVIGKADTGILLIGMAVNLLGSNAHTTKTLNGGTLIK
jgi:hypothetical protein